MHSCSLNGRNFKAGSAKADNLCIMNEQTQMRHPLLYATLHWGGGGGWRMNNLPTIKFFVSHGGQLPMSIIEQ